MESAPPNPLGTLILLGLLMFIVYRILLSLSAQNMPKTGGGSSGANIFHLSDKRQNQPPALAKLVPYTGNKDPFDGKSEAVVSHKVLIEKGGLDRIGDFTIEEMPGFVIRAFTHPEKCLVGVIYRDPIDRVWVNLISEYKDGRIVTLSSAERGAVSTSRPSGMPLFNYPGLDTEQLLRRHKLDTRGVKLMPALAPEDFPGFFARNYAKLRAHVYEKEQQNADETRGATVVDDATAIEPMADNVDINTVVDDDIGPTKADLRNWLNRIYETVNVPKENRAQFQKGLVWIMDNSDVYSISQTISEYSGVTIEQVEQGRLVIRTESGAEDIIDPGDLKGPALFDKINSSIPESRRFYRVPVNLKGVSFYSKTAI